MSKILFETPDRAEAHAELEKLLKEHPAAECREDPNTGLVAVWDGPAEKE